MDSFANLIWIAYLLNIVIIIAIVCFKKKNPISTMAWIMCLMIIPAIGGIIYLIFGVGLKSYAQYKYKKKSVLNENHISERQKETQSVQDVENLPYSDMIKYFLNANSGYSENNEVNIFTDAKKKYDALFEDIKNAKKSINMLYFIIRNDTVGNALIDLLTKKAKEGVKVRLMYDGLGSMLTPRRLFDRLRAEEGSEVEEFFPVRILSMAKINHRNHRKIVVIDDETAYMGGMNIGDEYMSRNPRRNLPWRDTHIRVKGEAVEYIMRCFAQDWEFSTGKKIDMSGYENRKDSKGNVKMQIVSSGPDTENEEIKCGMIQMIYRAKKYVYIQSPYFVPDEAFLTAVQTAARAGVDVRVMIPGMPDKKYVYHTTMSYVGELLDAGVKVLLYPGFIHSKTVTVDDRVATIGSTNIDIRSFRLLFELNAFMYSPELAEENHKIFKEDEAVCRELTMKEYKNRGIGKMIVEGFFRLFSPIM